MQQSHFAIKSDIAFSFSDKMESNYGVYLVAMVAGFAEMLVPNIMNNLAKYGYQKSMGGKDE